MITKTINIGESININYIHTDKFKTNRISFNFITQLHRPTKAFAALIPVVLTRGCRKYPTLADLNRKMQYLYSADIDTLDDKYGEYLTFGLSSDILNDRFTGDINMAEEMTQFLCDIIFDPYLEDGMFSEKYVEAEKNHLIDLIESKINNKGAYALERCCEEMYKDEIYSIKKIGYIEDIEKITASSLYEAYKNALRSYKIEIFVTGDCDIEKVAAIFGSYTKKLERDVQPLLSYPIVKSAKEIKRIEETQVVNQGKLCIGMRMGCRTGDKSIYAARYFTEIFGSGDMSKLFVNVREKISLCYSINARLGSREGVIVVSAGIDFDKKDEVEKAIYDQLDAIRNGDISDEEFNGAKAVFRNAYVRILDSKRAMELSGFTKSIFGIDMTLDEERRCMDSVTPEDVVELAKGITVDTVYFLKGEECDG